MIRFRPLASVLAAACWLADEPPSVESAQASVAPRRSVDLSLCRLANGDTSALCGKYEVFEDRAARFGRKIALKIVVLPALTPTPQPDPVYFFAGGPGASATALAQGERDRLLSQLRRHRAAVFVDQRGTGESNPLTCKFFHDDRGMQGYLGELFPPDLVRECRERLERRADLRLYTTSLAMDDLDEVRAALGHERINLYGESYGTLAATTYLRQYPQRVRAASLSGVFNPAMKLPLQFLGGAQRSLDRLLADCAADPECQTAFPKLEEELAAVLARFARSPVRFDVVDPSTGRPESVSLARDVFVEQVRLMLYQLRPSSRLPLHIHRAFRGDYTALAEAAASRSKNTAAIVSLGMYLTVTCSESVWAITEAEVQREARGAFVGDHRVRQHQAACRNWVRGETPESFYAPLRSDVPVLMLSGELDGATPPAFAAAMQEHLPSSRQLLLPNEAHNYQSDCAMEIIAEFFAKGSARELNADCTRERRRPPFATETTTP